MNSRTERSRSSLRALWEKLERGRSTERRRLVAQGLLWSLAAAAGLLSVLTLLGLLPDGPDPRVASALLLALGAAIAVTRAYHATPSVQEMARRADHRYHVDELFSTAVEVAELEPVGEAQAPVRTALLRSARRAAQRIEPARLSNVRIRRAGLAASALTVVAAVSLLLPVRLPALLGPDAARSPRVELGADEREAVAANVRRVAQLVERAAEERNDAYLQAVARSLAQFEADVGSGGLDDAAIRRETDRLVRHAQRALRGSGSTASNERLQAELTSLAVALGMRDAFDASREPAEDATATAPTDGDRPTASASEGQAPGPGEPTDQAAEEDTSGPVVSSNQWARTGELADQSTVGYPEVAPRSELELQAMERLRQQQEAAGQSIGASQDATRGASAIAGEGVQPLTDGSDDAEWTAESQEGVLLPDEEEGSGRRIRIEIPPEAQLSAVAGITTPAGDWRVLAEAPVSRTRLHWRHRLAVGRYFTPPEEGDAGASGEGPGTDEERE